MGCERYNNYGHGELLSWVEGNDVFLKARVYEKVVTDADSSSSEGDEPAGNAAGTVEERAVDLTAFDDVKVELVKSFGARTDIETAIDQTEDNCLVVHCPYTLESGEYALEIRLMKDGLQARSFDIQFAVVQTDCEAQTTFEVIDGCRSASLRVTLQVVSQALVRGKSAYELWKELPGNEDKGLQDFIDEVLDLNAIATRAVTAAKAAEQAATNANDKAALANEKATLANEKAALADEKAGLADEKAGLASEKAALAAEKAGLASEKAGLAASAAVLANEKAALANEKAGLADQKATEAGNVNASLSGTILTVTNRYGESESVDVKDQLMLFEVDDDMQLSVTKADDSTVVFGLENGYLTVDDTDNGN